MKKLKKTLFEILMLGIVVGTPIALGSYLLNAASAPAPLDYEPGAIRPFDDAQPEQPAPLVNGVLYTNGPVKVDWNGVRIPVQNTTYAYSGGEMITTAPNGMGILSVEGGGTVFICPGSKVRLSRNASGETLLEVLEGSGRFKFERDRPFRVRVNNTSLTAAPVAPGDEADATQPYSGEGNATADGGCVLCNLSSNLLVSVQGPDGHRSATARSGDVLTVRGRAEAGAATGADDNPISSVRLPANVLATIQTAMASNGSRGVGYLCKCRELRDYAEAVGAGGLAAQDPLQLSTGLDASTDGTASGAGPQQDSALPDPELGVSPPPVPGVTIADSDAPDPFVPGLLPAAGEETTQTQSSDDVVVPPPLVPASGSGGGGTVSSS